MKTIHLCLALLTLATVVHAQSKEQTIEGYWQDTARGMLFSREAGPSYAYGQ